MAHVKINHSSEPIRLFKSDFLEFFTHIHPAVVLIIYVPVVLYFFLSAALWSERTPLFIIGVYLIGIFIWTPSEYLLHRFVFHFKARGSWQERITFLFHGVHHAQPMEKTRLVMPPVASIPMAAIFYGLFYLLVGKLLGGLAWVSPLFAGFMTGYVIYDMIHYATHHFSMKYGVWRELRRHHMQHHGKSPNARYGVSSPLWDYVFGTMPKG